MKRMRRRSMPKRLLDSLVVDAATSARMSRVRTADTDAERIVRDLATKVGLHYRVRNPDLPGSPDLANRARGWAVFVHGCFWHAHRSCAAATIPRRNRAYWTAKFSLNKARDARVLRELHAKGFRTVVVWECKAMRDPHVVEATLRRLHGTESLAVRSPRTRRSR